MTVTPCNDSKQLDFGAVDQLFKDVVQAQFLLGKEIIRLVGDGVEAARESVGAFDLPKRKSCCAVPEPCWMPVPIGVAACALNPGGSGQIHVTVTNSDYRTRVFAFSTAGTDAAMLQLSSTQATLGPMEQAQFTADVNAPGTAGTYEALVWVNGCREHYLRVVLKVGTKQKGCCYNVAVNDKPDYVVHWYDHFYCRKPCPAKSADGEITTKSVGVEVTKR
jgi:hypothetical protein